MNSENILLEVAIAIKHRCISATKKWYVIYYYNRICCVPTYENVPPEIILCKFTDKDAQEGFDLKLWTELSNQIVKIYKELNT